MERKGKGEEPGALQLAGISHLLRPLASHPDPGLSTLPSSGSCPLRLGDGCSHLGLGSSCSNDILRLHPPSLGQSLPRLGRLGTGGCPLPGRCCLEHTGGNTGALCGSLLGRGRSLGAWEGHTTDTCWLSEIKDIILAQEGCLEPSGSHLPGTRSLRKSTGSTGALGNSLLGWGYHLGLCGGCWSRLTGG